MGWARPPPRTRAPSGRICSTAGHGVNGPTSRTPQGSEVALGSDDAPDFEHAELGDVAKVTASAIRLVCVRSSRGNRELMTDPMYSTDPDGEEDGNQPEAGDFEDDQEPADRSPTPGNAPAPGQRPSESGSTSSDIPTEPE